MRLLTYTDVTELIQSMATQSVQLLGQLPQVPWAPRLLTRYSVLQLPACIPRHPSHYLRGGVSCIQRLLGHPTFNIWFQCLEFYDAVKVITGAYKALLDLTPLSPNLGSYCLPRPPHGPLAASQTHQAHPSSPSHTPHMLSPLLELSPGICMTRSPATRVLLQ